MSNNKHNVNLAYTKKNYLLIAAGFVLVLIGFFVMSGDEDIYSFSKTTLPVLLILAGFCITGVGIMLKPKQ